MSGHTRKHPTKDMKRLRTSLIEKIGRLDKEEDLWALNNVIDKYVNSSRDSVTPGEVFEEDWKNLDKKLGRMIQGLRFREGLTQTELAKALKGVRQTNISSWESGKEKVPVKRIEQLSKIFGTDLKKIFDASRKKK